MSRFVGRRGVALPNTHSIRDSNMQKFRKDFRVRKKVVKRLFPF
jgi:hypothetical protein